MAQLTDTLIIGDLRVTGKVYGNSTQVSLPRNPVSNYNDDYNMNTLSVSELGPTLTNRPSDNWYHTYTGCGSDTGYATQLALGMTTEKLMYRYKDNGTWKSWTSIVRSTANTQVGSTSTPVYIDSNGKAQECTQYAGGTAVSVNQTSYGGSTASIFAPTSVAGSSGARANYLVISNDAGNATWKLNTSVTVGCANYLQDKGGTSGNIIYSHWRGTAISKVSPSSGETASGTKWLVGAYSDTDGAHYCAVDAANVTIGQADKLTDRTNSARYVQVSYYGSGTISNSYDVQYIAGFYKPDGDSSSVICDVPPAKLATYLSSSSVKVALQNGTYTNMTVGNSQKINGYQIVVGGLGTDTNTLYFI